MSKELITLMVCHSIFFYIFMLLTPEMIENNSKTKEKMAQVKNRG